MFLSTYELEHGRHVARLHHRRRRRRRRAYAPRAIPLAMIHMRKSIHGFPFVPLYGYGAPLRPPELRQTSPVELGSQISYDCDYSESVLKITGKVKT